MNKVIIIVASILLTNYSVAAQTKFSGNTGAYGELLSTLEKLIVTDTVNFATFQFRGKTRTAFVTWIRDHVHVMKAMKYYHPDQSSFLEFFMEQQTPEGFYYDYIYPLNDGVANRFNFFPMQYTAVVFDDKKTPWQMHRIPAEADVEYLVVEGAYAAWQATGDTTWVRKWLPTLEKGLNSIMSDPLRWSKKHQLVKRAYTIDTWDFQPLPMPVVEWQKLYGDPSRGIFMISDTTRMGVMHGDNSGFYAACKQLAKLYDIIGNIDKAKIWNLQGYLIQARANALCWNGKFYKHFVEDDPQPSFLKMDHDNTISLSNPYDINRNLPDEKMAQSIIQYYMDLKEKTKNTSFAEWFSIYPFYEPDYGGILPGEYVNGGILTIVAGELAKAAFQHGYETYGADILKRLNDLTKKHNGTLPVCYQPDGTVSYGVPDNWGQAAIVSALVEGLAGIVDKSTGFQDVEISPRWWAAGQAEASVNVSYPASNATVQYDYNYDKKANSLQLNIKGSFKTCQLRLLTPAKAAEVVVNGRKSFYQIEMVKNSTYLVLPKQTASTLQVEVKFKSK